MKYLQPLFFRWLGDNNGQKRKRKILAGSEDWKCFQFYFCGYVFASDKYVFIVLAVVGWLRDCLVKG